MADPLTMGIGFGLSALGSAFDIGGRRRQAKRRKKEEQKALDRIRQLQTQSSFGPTASEGALAERVTRGTLSGLAERGVLDSSISGPSVAAAVAPIEERRQSRLQGLTERLASAELTVAQGEPIPGYEEAFAQGFGDVGSFFALRAGIEEGIQREEQMFKRLNEARLSQLGAMGFFDEFNSFGLMSSIGGGL